MRARARARGGALLGTINMFVALSHYLKLYRGLVVCVSWGEGKRVPERTCRLCDLHHIPGARGTYVGKLRVQESQHTQSYTVYVQMVSGRHSGSTQTRWNAI